MHSKYYPQCGLEALGFYSDKAGEGDAYRNCTDSKTMRWLRNSIWSVSQCCDHVGDLNIPMPVTFSTLDFPCQFCCNGVPRRRESFWLIFVCGSDHLDDVLFGLRGTTCNKRITADENEQNVCRALRSMPW